MNKVIKGQETGQEVVADNSQDKEFFGLMGDKVLPYVAPKIISQIKPEIDRILEATKEGTDKAQKLLEELIEKLENAGLDSVKKDVVNKIEEFQLSISKILDEKNVEISKSIGIAVAKIEGHLAEQKQLQGSFQKEVLDAVKNNHLQLVSKLKEELSKVTLKLEI